jgi:hypothetical protein
LSDRVRDRDKGGSGLCDDTEDVLIFLCGGSVADEHRDGALPVPPGRQGQSSMLRERKGVREGEREGRRERERERERERD